MTLIVQIGNSDDKLSQKDWSRFGSEVDALIQDFAAEVYFSGHSHGLAAWQNYCWVFTAHQEGSLRILEELRGLAASYGQDSIAVTIGHTEFIRP
jgi:hypothetical protein